MAAVTFASTTMPRVGCEGHLYGEAIIHFKLFVGVEFIGQTLQIRSQSGTVSSEFVDRNRRGLKGVRKMIGLHGEMHRVVGLKVRQSIHTRLHGLTQRLHEFFTQFIIR